MYVYQASLAVTLRRPRAKPALLIVALGAVLFLAAAVYHGGEMLALRSVAGPLVALLLDGLPALAVVFLGYHVLRTDFTPQDQRVVLVWSLGGGVLFLSAMWATVLVRISEGRGVVEPAFPLLIAANVGALAGLVAGYYHARSRVDARRARAVGDALSFVNDLLRHDLRNDLNVIAGHAELVDAADGSGDPAVIAEKTDEALARIETTRAVTETLVGDSELEPTDLAAIAAELAARFEATHGVAVTTDLPDSALVAANAGLRSVADNLIENAVEHNDVDDPRVAVAVTVDRDTVRLTVSDNGPGIPDERDGALFDTNRRGAGRGGLVLVTTLVEGYGGTVRAEANEPRGARVVVELPRVESGA